MTDLFDDLTRIVCTKGEDVATMKTAITKWENNQGVCIPRDILDDMNIVAGDFVEIFADNEVILIKKRRVKKSIQELFAEYDGTYMPEEIKWGTH
jgi:antitoxin MazE